MRFTKQEAAQILARAVETVHRIDERQARGFRGRDEGESPNLSHREPREWELPREEKRPEKRSSDAVLSAAIEQRIMEQVEAKIAEVKDELSGALVETLRATSELGESLEGMFRRWQAAREERMRSDREEPKSGDVLDYMPGARSRSGSRMN